MHQNLIGLSNYSDPQTWLEQIRLTEVKFRQILKWVSCFALSVNESQCRFGKNCNTTNGSAGVIPSVLMYYLVIENHNAKIKQFLLVAGEIGVFSRKDQPYQLLWAVAKQR
jgi:L-serine dehydratase